MHIRYYEYAYNEPRNGLLFTLKTGKQNLYVKNAQAKRSKVKKNLQIRSLPNVMIMTITIIVIRRINIEMGCDFVLDENGEAYLERLDTQNLCSINPDALKSSHFSIIIILILVKNYVIGMKEKNRVQLSCFTV